MPIRHVLIANRAEIARRIIRTCRGLGIRTTAVYSDADRRSLHVREADVGVHIGGAEPAESYLNGQAILEAAERTGADAIHPGYGFLSENADFAQSVISAGLTWIGPPPAAMRALGNKAAARATAQKVGIPVLPGYDGSDPSDDAFFREAMGIGFPLLVKASSGGGGRGMRRVNHPSELRDALASARREAQTAFGNDRLLLERFVERPRHIEVQIFGDHHGNVVHLWERECSIQRRHQKIIEEAPSGGISEVLRLRLGEAAIRLAKAAGYACAGTVEFLVEENGLYLLEMNARLQVEHPVTEMITGLDLVALQIAISEGRPLPFQEVPRRGHAIEARLCAEDPLRDFLPQTGTLVRLDIPLSQGSVRADTGFAAGDVISHHYDSLVAKLIAFGPDRDVATQRMRMLLDRTWAPGVATNLPLLRQILWHDHWERGVLHTGFLAENDLPKPPPLNMDRGAVAASLVCATLAKEAAGAHAAAAEVPAAWRIEGPARQTDTFRCGAETVEVGIIDDGDGGYVVDLVGWPQPARVLHHEGDAWTVEISGQVENWRVARVGETFYVHFGDGEAYVERVPRFVPPEAAAEPGTLVATTPGKVAKVSVSVGVKVERGTLLVVLEAMKMEHRIVAPEAGTVAEVRVRVGDTVAQGALLVKLS